MGKFIPSAVQSARRRPQLFLLAWLAALFITGAGYCLFTPVFEGFDENAHYSSLQQLSDTGAVPVHGSAFLDSHARGYAGPTAYGSGAPPFDQGLTYGEFFADPARVGAYGPAYRTPGLAWDFEKSTTPNWAAQHPPLYYAVLAPLNRLLEGQSLVDRLLLLRLASLVLAGAGVFLGLRAATSGFAGSEAAAEARLGFVLYPLMLPMVFPEFARLGNDALCLFWMGAIVSLLTAAGTAELGRGRACALGLVLGLGLLTKALFVPILLGIAGFLLFRALAARADSRLMRARLVELGLLGALAALVGSGWYLYQYAAFGALSGSDESIRLAREGGLVEGLKARFSVLALVRGMLVALASFVWAGTWSLTLLPLAYMAPLLVLAGLVGLASGGRAAPGHAPLMLALTIWALGLFVAGLLWHMFVSLARTGAAGTPGWYLHIFLPVLAPLIGHGARRLLDSRLRLVFVGLVLWAVAYQVAAVWSGLALYAGCAAKGPDKIFTFSAPVLCLSDAGEVMARLSVLVYPQAGLVLFGSGLALLLGLAALLALPRPGGLRTD